MINERSAGTGTTGASLLLYEPGSYQVRGGLLTLTSASLRSGYDQCGNSVFGTHCCQTQSPMLTAQTPTSPARKGLIARLADPAAAPRWSASAATSTSPPTA